MNWLRRLLGLHIWHYHNPYDRTCSICGQHEVQHCRAWGGSSWWEVFRDGDQHAHKEAAARAANTLRSN